MSVSALPCLDAPEPLASGRLPPGEGAAGFRIADYVELEREAAWGKALVELEDAGVRGKVLPGEDRFAHADAIGQQRVRLRLFLRQTKRLNV